MEQAIIRKGFVTWVTTERSVTIKVFHKFFLEIIDFYANTTSMNQFPECRSCLYFLSWIFQLFSIYFLILAQSFGWNQTLIFTDSSKFFWKNLTYKISYSVKTHKTEQQNVLGIMGQKAEMNVSKITHSVRWILFQIPECKIFKSSTINI